MFLAVVATLNASNTYSLHDTRYLLRATRSLSAIVIFYVGYNFTPFVTRYTLPVTRLLLVLSCSRHLLLVM